MIKLSLAKYKGVGKNNLSLFLDEYMFHKVFIGQQKQHLAFEIIAKCVGRFYNPQKKSEFCKNGFLCC